MKVLEIGKRNENIFEITKLNKLVLNKSNICSTYRNFVRFIEKFKYQEINNNMIDEILNSKLKLKIAKFFASSNAELQVSDVARILEISKSRASECLKELADKKLLECRKIGRSLVYKKASNQFAKKIFESLMLEKTLEYSLKKDLIRKLKKFNPISIAVFGSSTQKLKVNSDIDVLLLTKNELEEEEIYKISSELSETYGINISILVMKEDEFIKKVRSGDAFAINLLATHKKLFGKDLEEIVWR